MKRKLSAWADSSMAWLSAESGGNRWPALSRALSTSSTSKPTVVPVTQSSSEGGKWYQNQRPSASSGHDEGDPGNYYHCSNQDLLFVTLQPIYRAFQRGELAKVHFLPLQTCPVFLEAFCLT